MTWIWKIGFEVVSNVTGDGRILGSGEWLIESELREMSAKFLEELRRRIYTKDYAKEGNRAVIHIILAERLGPVEA